MDVKKFIITMVLLLIIDYIWLNTTKGIYNQTVSAVQGDNIQINYLGAFISYLTIVVSFGFFVVPYLSSGNYGNAVKYGGLLGLCMYGVFNGTNIAIFKNYSYSVALMDTVWGGVLYSIVAIIYTALLS
jgi:uncharacterized membrane protein